MTDANTVEISGTDLGIDQLATFVAGCERRVLISEQSSGLIERGHEFLLSSLTDQVIYGVNTGFGPMASCILGRDQLVQLQYNLIRSHATGAGDPIEPRFVLAAMVVRLNTLVRGYSGVSGDLVRTLAAFINHRIVPIVPEHGAVGASGDLVQLAHIALALIGEGEVLHDGVRAPTADVLRNLRVRPHALQPKEGLALINGTAMMTGIAALLCHDAEHLLDLATRASALCLEIVGAFDDSICDELHALRSHPGQRLVAARLREHLASSRRLRNRSSALADYAIEATGRRIDETVQEVYSLRCVPQILGPVHDALASVRARIETELNAVTDNPVVLWERKRFLHGGNFHGDYVAASMDQLKVAMVKLTLLSERRINFCLNAKVNKLLPPFLNLRTLGFNLALQGLQFVATSTAAHSQTLAYPQHLHSIPTNGDNQDVVSLGTDAGLIASKVIENACIVLAVELVTLAQAVDCLHLEAELSPNCRELYEIVRAEVAPVTDDRAMYGELATLRRRLLRTPASVSTPVA
jgi:histidine ammonia-lyase